MTAAAHRGLIDTSVLIAAESGRRLDRDALPRTIALSAITIAELTVGVLAARDDVTRARRLRTLDAAQDVIVLPVDRDVAASWALLRVRLAALGRRLNVNDLWIAATALTHDLPIVTQDADFDPIAGVSGIVVSRV